MTALNYAGRRALHDTRFSPAGLWQLNGASLLDTSGNARNLTLSTGTLLQGPGFVQDTKVGYFNGNTRLTQADAVFNRPGDLTVMFLMQYQPSGGSYIAPVSYGVNTGSNHIYFAVGLNSPSNNCIDAFLINAGTLSFAASGGAAQSSITHLGDYNEWVHIAVSKPTATSMKFYLNGDLLHNNTMPAVGTPSTLTFNLGGLQGSFPNFYHGHLASVAYYATTLSDADIQREARRVLGR